MRAKIRPVMERFLKSLDHCRLATIGSDGTPHCVPVSYCYDEGMLYVPANSRSVKVRNLMHNPRCCVIIDEYRDGKGTGVMLQGNGNPSTGDEFERLNMKLESLTGWHLHSWQLGQPPRDKVDTIVVITPDSLVEIGQAN